MMVAIAEYPSFFILLMLCLFCFRSMFGRIFEIETYLGCIGRNFCFGIKEEERF